MYRHSYFGLVGVLCGKHGSNTLADALIYEIKFELGRRHDQFITLGERLFPNDVHKGVFKLASIRLRTNR